MLANRYGEIKWIHDKDRHVKQVNMTDYTWTKMVTEVGDEFVIIISWSTDFSVESGHLTGVVAGNRRNFRSIIKQILVMD